ncbi:MAG: hypothetical protein ACKOYP_08470 [Bacteroidota bacterium]
MSIDSVNLRLCAHNGKEFDFPYLCRRMIINGIPLPPSLDLSGRKPWEVKWSMPSSLRSKRPVPITITLPNSA